MAIYNGPYLLFRDCCRLPFFLNTDQYSFPYLLDFKQRYE
jgi:hypothetical protein